MVKIDEGIGWIVIITAVLSDFSWLFGPRCRDLSSSGNPTRGGNGLRILSDVYSRVIVFRFRFRGKGCFPANINGRISVVTPLILICLDLLSIRPSQGLSLVFINRVLTLRSKAIPAAVCSQSLMVCHQEPHISKVL